MQDSSSMKKVSHEFQKRLSGQTLQVTKRGKPLLHSSKPAQRSVKLPDFRKDLDHCGIPKSFGNKLLKDLYDSVS